MALPGSINWGKSPPQSYIYCGCCGDHFMICTCKGLEYGVDYMYKNLPPPSPNSTQLERLRRFCDLVSVSPTMGRFNAHGWLKNEAPDLIAALNREQTQGQLRQMMEEYMNMFLADPVEYKLTIMAQAVGGEPLMKKPPSTQIKIITKEGRAAIESFIACDWATVTKSGICLINNSFQASDPKKYPLDDPYLKAVFEKGVDCLHSILFMGYSDNVGWRLAMEPDRQPMGTNDPNIQTVTRRDYFLRWYNSTHCQNCQKESNSLSLCTGCRSVMYCNKECQKKHWKHHKETCKEIKRDGAICLELD